VLDWLVEFIDMIVEFYARLRHQGSSLGFSLLVQFAFIAGIIAVSSYWSYRRWIRIRILSSAAWAVERNLPIDSVLACLESEAWNGFWGFRYLGWRRIVSGLRERLRRGFLFAVACRPWHLFFGERRLCVLHEAERTGRLGDALRVSVRLLREEERARHDSRIILFYPFFIFVFVILFVLIIMGIVVWILPQFQVVCDDMGAEITWCRAMMRTFAFVGDVMLRYAGVLVPGLLLLALLAYFQWPFVVQRGWLHWIPGIGTLARLGAARNSCEVVCALAGQGVPLRDLLSGFTEGAWYTAYRKMGRRWSGGVERGEDFPGLVSRERLLPPAAREFIVLGIRSGDLAAGFRRASNYLASRIVFVRRVLAMLTAALFIGCCGLLIGWIATSIIGTLADLNMLVVP
jgi:type II secretory pathway component PulF